MASVLSSLVSLFSRAKKRHNTDSQFSHLSRPPHGAGLTGQQLTRAEFLSVYESMPEAARIKLFSSLNSAQKERLLELLSGGVKKTTAAAAADEPAWDAEDFLPEKDERKVARLRQLKEINDLKNVFASVEKYPAGHVAEILGAESVSIAAMVLLQFRHSFASQVLRALPELKRGEIVRAMATERQIVSEALAAVARQLSARLASMATEVVERVDGVKHVNEILKLLNVDEAERITREVRREDSTLAQALESNRYTFESLSELNARDFRILFSSIPDEQVWARALKAMDGGERKAMLGKLPIKRAGLIVSAMAEIQPTRLDGIDKARSKILAQALKLARAHEIRFAGNGLH